PSTTPIEPGWAALERGLPPASLGIECTRSPVSPSSTAASEPIGTRVPAEPALELEPALPLPPGDEHSDRSDRMPAPPLAPVPMREPLLEAGGLSTPVAPRSPDVVQGTGMNPHGGHDQLVVAADATSRHRDSPGPPGPADSVEGQPEHDRADPS